MCELDPEGYEEILDGPMAYTFNQLVLAGRRCEQERDRLAKERDEARAADGEATSLLRELDEAKADRDAEREFKLMAVRERDDALALEKALRKALEEMRDEIKCRLESIATVRPNLESFWVWAECRFKAALTPACAENNALRKAQP